ncbi:MAG: transposase [Alkalibacterium sp.]|nr:transposase [Alkalibacterium sp.]
MAKKKRTKKGKYHKWLEEDGLIQLEAWARDGLVDEQIAENIGIVPATLYVWKKKYPEISEALKRGKEIVDIQVENALLKRALGYQYDEVTYEFGEESKRVTKEVAPDTTSMIFWLKNRKPGIWRDRKETEITGSMDVNNPFKDLTTEELRKLADTDG